MIPLYGNVPDWLFNIITWIIAIPIYIALYGVFFAFFIFPWIYAIYKIVQFVTKKRKAA